MTSKCIQCSKEHYEEYDRYFCSETCEKRWDAKLDWDIDHTFNSDEGVICPFCEHEHDAMGHTELYDENLDQFECENCGKVFSVTPNLSWSWETKPLDSDYEGMEKENE